MSETKTPLFRWKFHGSGTPINPGDVVLPSERFSQSRIVGIGAQYVVAMFGATFLVPLLMGFPLSTMLFFTATGILPFFLITVSRLPSYLGSSFAPIVSVQAVSSSMGPSYALDGITAVGAMLVLVGLTVYFIGVRQIDTVTPPAVTGAIVTLIGLNLASAARDWVKRGSITAAVIVVSVCVVTVLFKGILGRLSILISALIGYLVTIYQGEADFSKVSNTARTGFSEFHTPVFSFSTLGPFLSVVLTLVAENAGHVKSVSAMTGENMDDLTGHAFVADGLPTMLAGSGGGSGTTTYAENIGVTVATRVYSATAYIIAAGVALVLSMPLEFGTLIATTPPGVLGGAGTALYGTIGILGVRTRVQNRVDFSNPVNLNTAAVVLIIAIANFTWAVGDMTFGGIVLGMVVVLLIYHGMRLISELRGTNLEAAILASMPSGSELEGEAYSKRHRSPAPQADA